MDRVPYHKHIISPLLLPSGINVYNPNLWKPEQVWENWQKTAFEKIKDLSAGLCPTKGLLIRAKHTAHLPHCLFLKLTFSALPPVPVRRTGLTGRSGGQGWSPRCKVYGCDLRIWRTRNCWYRLVFRKRGLNTGSSSSCAREFWEGPRYQTRPLGFNPQLKPTQDNYGDCIKN